MHNLHWLASLVWPDYWSHETTGYIPYTWNYWQVEYLAIRSKMQLARFLIGVLSTVWKETHECSLNDVHLIWRNLRDLPNRLIKATAKYTMHTVVPSGSCVA